MRHRDRSSALIGRVFSRRGSSFGENRGYKYRPCANAEFILRAGCLSRAKTWVRSSSSQSAPDARAHASAAVTPRYRRARCSRSVSGAHADHRPTRRYLKGGLVSSQTIVYPDPATHVKEDVHTSTDFYVFPRAPPYRVLCASVSLPRHGRRGERLRERVYFRGACLCELV